MASAAVSGVEVSESQMSPNQVRMLVIIQSEIGLSAVEPSWSLHAHLSCNK